MRKSIWVVLTGLMFLPGIVKAECNMLLDVPYILVSHSTDRQLSFNQRDLKTKLESMGLLRWIKRDVGGAGLGRAIICVIWHQRKKITVEALDIMYGQLGASNVEYADAVDLFEAPWYKTYFDGNLWRIRDGRDGRPVDRIPSDLTRLNAMLDEGGAWRQKCTAPPTYNVLPTCRDGISVP